MRIIALFITIVLLFVIAPISFSVNLWQDNFDDKKLDKVNYP